MALRIFCAKCRAHVEYDVFTYDESTCVWSFRADCHGETERGTATEEQILAAERYMGGSFRVMDVSVVTAFDHSR